MRAAVPAVHKADPGSEAVIGELAPVGNKPISDNTPMAPLPFLRAFGCVDDRYHVAPHRRLQGFKAASGDSFGYHPHPKKLAPDQPNPNPDDAQFGDLSGCSRRSTSSRTANGSRRRAAGSRSA